MLSILHNDSPTTPLIFSPTMLSISHNASLHSKILFIPREYIYPLNPIFQRQMKTIFSQHHNIPLPSLILVREKVLQSLTWKMDRNGWHKGLEIPQSQRPICLMSLLLQQFQGYISNSYQLQSSTSFNAHIPTNTKHITFNPILMLLMPQNSSPNILNTPNIQSQYALVNSSQRFS